MIISSLKLSNFRNFSHKELDFNNLVTMLVGENTIGKTSILEAIYYLATGKSSRADRDQEVIQWGEEMGRINGKITNYQLPTSNQIQNSKFSPRGEAGKIQNDNSKFKIKETEKLEIIFAETKRFFVNGVARRMVDFAGICKAVLFRPEDLELITDSPSLRRRYLDFVLVQVDREYRRSLISYEKGIRQRNKLLERIRDEAAFSRLNRDSASQGAFKNQLVFWDQLLIKNGNYLSVKRDEFINFLNNTAQKNLGDFKIFYDVSRISPARLEQYAEEEVAAGVTLVGPHRDDFQIIKKQIASSPSVPRNDKFVDLSVYGSRGEQRLAILWLKLGEMEFIEKMTGERPILLLDDIFSELDHQHRKLVMEIIDKQQTIITTADKHYIEKGGEMEIVEL